MKKMLPAMLLALMVTIVNSQAPGIFNYQGVARNSLGNVLQNKNITLRLSVHDGTESGTVVYSETRAVTTNQFGLFNVQIGSAGASAVTGTIATVNWGTGKKYLQVEIDPGGGTSFIHIGTSQLASVPYAYFAGGSIDLALPFNKSQAETATLFGLTNMGTGSAGRFDINNTGNSSAALQATSNGSGSAGLFNSTNTNSTANAVDINIAGGGYALQLASTHTTPKALRTVGGVQLTGLGEAPDRVLTSDAAGNASWQTPRTTSADGGGTGFGSWGDCSTNGIGNYNPVWDTAGSANDYFGYRVSVSGNYAIVGAPFDDVSTNDNQGSASIYYYNGTNWVLMQKITDATGEAGDGFGLSVSLSGNYAIVGATADDVGGNSNQGSASIYRFNGTSWVLMQKITDAAGAAEDYFGSSVSVSGNFVIVGAYFDDIGANGNQGSASIYQFNGTSWVLMQKITDPTGEAEDYFGYSVAVSGNFAIAGVPIDDLGANTDQGSACIYQYNGTNWILLQKISDIAGEMEDNYGYSVSISGNYALVGAHHDDVGTIVDKGSACIYQYNGTNFILMEKITDTTGAAGDNFGVSVSLSGNYAIIGAYLDDVGSHLNQGSAAIYQRVGLAWQKLQYITDPGGRSLDYFGIAVTIDGNTHSFLIGAFNYASTSGKAIFGKIR